jgi:nucleotide-binding universal stress UspA family protein
MARRVVIGYDGTDEAKRAVDAAARVLFADCALIVHVWHDPASPLVAAPAAAPPALPTPEQEAQVERAAREVAEEGADLARAAGMDAMIAIRRGGGAGEVARVLHDVAEAYSADLVVVGHRHASRLESAVLGSVSTSAVRDERRPVLVVPA